MRPRRDGDSDLRAVPLIEALDQHDVRYVAVGSYAAIAQGVDLDVTDLDIVPARDEGNRTRLVEALRDLAAKEKIGDTTEPLYDLTEDPSSLTDTTFREFVTDFGKLDIVFRPAGFPRGYDDLIERVVIVRLQDEADPTHTVDVVMAEKQALYDSKRNAGRTKDVDVLAKFEGIHPVDIKESMRQKYREGQVRRAEASPTPKEPSPELRLGEDHPPSTDETPDADLPMSLLRVNKGQKVTPKPASSQDPAVSTSHPYRGPSR